MAEPISYEQIVREMKAKKALKPWEMVISEQGVPAESPQATGAAQMAAVDPMAMAQQREKLMQGLASAFGTMANPETQMAQQGAAPNPGLMQLLMGLMRK